MSYERLAYDDADTARQMADDCAAAEAGLGLADGLAVPGRRSAAQRAARAAVRPAPSIRYEDFPREIAKPSIDVSDAAARLAAALDLGHA